MCETSSTVKLLRWRILLFLGTLHFAQSDDRNHLYREGENVVVWTAKVGPVNNPHETYFYETLPLCELRRIVGAKRDATIGEALEGHHFVSSPRLEIQFGGIQ
eukprot:GHVN01059500.1.p3 GENE.GHVN01059500.1~~GHVN01059500.1.p3  ORF type:complete len:103 (+),score=11.85 GHVN01059500.1:1239-1547(+)